MTSVVLKCKHCPTKIVRAPFEPGNPWVHEGDETVVQGFRVTSFTNYDHEAEPDVIDVLPIQPDSKEDDASQRQAEDRPGLAWPFGAH